MRVLVLGSAAGGGFPQWNCNCGSCRRARAGDSSALARTQSSLAVSADGGRWVLVNASPDIRQQIHATPALHPRQGLRDSPIAGVVLTGAEVDHVAGLLSLRERHPFALYASRRVHDALAANPIFAALHPDIVPRRTLAPEQALPLAGADGAPLGVTVTPFAVPGKVALYLEDPAAGSGFGTREGDAIGLKIERSDTGKGFFCVPGCAQVDATLAARFRNAPLVFFDGTLYTDDEMIEAGLGDKTGRRMGHISISGPDGSLAAFAPLGVKRRVYIHINNSNPILAAESAERAVVEAAGWEVAFDGQEFRL